MLKRRSFLTGMAALLVAPAVIRVADLMPIKAVLTRPYAVVSGIDWQGTEKIVEVWEPMSAAFFGGTAHNLFQSVNSWQLTTEAFSDDAVERYIAERRQREDAARQAWREMSVTGLDINQFGGENG